MNQETQQEFEEQSKAACGSREVCHAPRSVVRMEPVMDTCEDCNRGEPHFCYIPSDDSAIPSMPGRRWRHKPSKPISHKMLLRRFDNWTLLWKIFGNDHDDLICDAERRCDSCFITAYLMQERNWPW